MIVSISFGHQAATIMLRDEFRQMLREQLSLLSNIQSNDQAVARLLQEMNSRGLDNENPLGRMRINDIRGDMIQLRYVLTPRSDREASRLGVTEEEYKAWQLRAMREALANLSTAIERTLQLIGEIGDCDEKELLKLTGVGFENVRARLRPKLMKLEESENSGQQHLHWIPDEDARMWLDRVGPVAQLVQNNDSIAKVDNMIITAGIVILATPLLTSAGFVWAAVALGVTDTAYGIYSEIVDSRAEQTTLDIASGGSSVLGTAQLDAAREQASDIMNATFRRLALLGGVFMEGVDLFQAIKATGRATRIASVQRGAGITSSLERRGFDSLSSDEVGDFLMFVERAETLRIANGIDSLDDTQRAALATMDHLRTRAPPETPDAPDIASADIAPRPDTPSSTDPELTAGTVHEPGVATLAPPKPKTGTELIKPEETVVDGPKTGDTLAPPKPKPDTELIKPEETVVDGPKTGDTQAPPKPKHDTELIKPEETVVDGPKPGGAQAPPKSATSEEPVVIIELPVRSALTGKPVRLGKYLGKGSFHIVFGNADNPLEAVRIPMIDHHQIPEADLIAAKLADTRGRRLLEGHVNDPDIAVIEEIERILMPEDFPIKDHGALAIGGLHIEIVRRSNTKNFSKIWKSLNRSSMMAREAIGWDRSHRALNRQGIVSMDNKYDNYNFQPHPTRPGELQLVWLDPGGIIAVKGRDPALARRIQQAIDSPPPEFSSQYINSDYRASLKRDLFLEIHKNDLDPSSIGFDRVEDIPFNPLSVEFLPNAPKARGLSRVPDDEVEAAYQRLLDAEMEK